LPEKSRRAFDCMPLETLDKASRLVFTSSLMPPSLTVLWHAGEPLAAGINFFKEALKIVDRNNIHSKRIGHSIQTNATLINQKWCELFKEWEFEIGVSIDGPEFLHDENRIGWHGNGSFKSAMNGLDHLRRSGLRYAAICVITKRSLDYPDEIFDFFVENGFRSIAFNIEEIEAANGRSTVLSSDEFQCTKDRYARFMKRMLERWITAKGEVHIREFDSLTRKILATKAVPHFVPMLDVSQGLQTLTVRTDGNLIAFSPELATGIQNAADAFVIGHVENLEELEDVFRDDRYLAIRRQIKSGIAKCRDKCGYFQLCGGGWPSNKFAENGTFDCAETRNCELHTKTLADVVLEDFCHRPEFAESIEPYLSAHPPM